MPLRWFLSRRISICFAGLFGNIWRTSKYVDVFVSNQFYESMRVWSQHDKLSAIRYFLHTDFPDLRLHVTTILNLANNNTTRSGLQDALVKLEILGTTPTSSSVEERTFWNSVLMSSISYYARYFAKIAITAVINRTLGGGFGPNNPLGAGPNYASSWRLRRV